MQDIVDAINTTNKNVIEGFARMDARFDKWDAHFDEWDAHFDEIDSELKKQKSMLTLICEHFNIHVSE